VGPGGKGKFQGQNHDGKLALSVAVLALALARNQARELALVDAALALMPLP
jgi:hypothetical protein